MHKPIDISAKYDPKGYLSPAEYPTKSQIEKWNEEIAEKIKAKRPKEYPKVRKVPWWAKAIFTKKRILWIGRNLDKVAKYMPWRWLEYVLLGLDTIAENVKDA